jgi:peptide subunit release factor 1 (eRF1)
MPNTAQKTLKLDPDNDEVRKLRDEVVEAQNAESKNHPKKN